MTARDSVLAYRSANPASSAAEVRQALKLRTSTRTIQRWAAEAGVPFERGRPAVGKRATAQIRLTPTAKAQLEREAKTLGASLSDAVATMCAENNRLPRWITHAPASVIWVRSHGLAGHGTAQQHMVAVHLLRQEIVGEVWWSETREWCCRLRGHRIHGGFATQSGARAALVYDVERVLSGELRI